MSIDEGCKECERCKECEGCKGYSTSYTTNTSLIGKIINSINGIFLRGFPLWLLFIYIFTSLFMVCHHHNIVSPHKIANYFMAEFLLCLSFFKILDVEGFSKSFSKYDKLAKQIPKWGYIYPYVEFTLGMLCLMEKQLYIVNIIIFFLMVENSWSVCKFLYNKSYGKTPVKDVKCACLGTAFSLPLGEFTIFENLIMICASLVAMF